MFRDATIDDSGAAARLIALVNPEGVISPAGFRHAWESTQPSARRASWCVEADGECVAWATATLMVETSEPGVGWIGVTVHPQHRGRGLGTALLDRAEQHAREIGVRRVLSWSRSDDASATFVRSHGFEQTASDEILVVDPRDIAPPTPPDDVELRPFAAFADDPSPIFHVDVTAMLDEPGEVRHDVLAYDSWLDRYWRHPLLDHEASTVALVGGKAVVATMLMIDRESGRGQNSGTGTLPGHRGRGLATLAKRASLSRAAELGCTVIYTGNDATNAPMLAINRKLGYQPCSTELAWGKTLVPTSGA